MKKKALLTGITGQNGSYLAELLIARGYEVHGLVRRSSTRSTERLSHLLEKGDKESAGLRIHGGDLTDTSALSRVLKEVAPDEVYNLGAQSHVGDSFREPEYTANVDALGPLRILEGLRTLDLLGHTRFFQASTSELYGRALDSPQNESTPFHPRSPYGVSKLFAYWITVNYREAYGAFACNGILFNHESPRRGDAFVTRKITRGLANIAQGLEECLYLGNLSALRDWGHARDFVEMQWLMLQQDEPGDFVIATGVQSSVRDFLTWSAEELGIDLEFEGEGPDTLGRVTRVTGEDAPGVAAGDVIVRVDPRLFRPAEVDSLLGDASRARGELGWEPRVTARELCAEMVAEDLTSARIRAAQQRSDRDQEGTSAG